MLSRSSLLLSPVVSRLMTTRSLAMKAASTIKPDKFQGKVAVVTASTDGIGLAIARRLAQEGAAVVISSRKEKNVAQTVSQLKGEGLNIVGTVCHVGKEEDRKKLLDFTLEHHGGVDFLVSNAAVNPFFGRMLDTPEAAFAKIMEVNVLASFLLTQTFVPAIRKRGGGSIVYVSSIGGYQVFPALGAYSVSKTALLGLTRGVAQDVAMDNIRANVVCPGIIETKFSEALTSNEGVSEESLKLIPQNRFGKPEDISGVVSFLLSDDASYITGESIVAAGGWYSRL